MSCYQIRLAGTPVGQLVENHRGVLGVRLYSAYRDMALRPVLGQQFEEDLTRTRWARRSGVLPSYLANLLPEGPMRSIIARSLRLDGPSDTELLAATGLDLPGAVEFVRAEPVEEFFESESGSEPLEASADTAGTGGLRFSLAGVQLKFSMVREGDRLTLPASGAGGEWIVKIESTAYPGLVDNEFAMLEWARAVGFVVPEHRVMDGESLESLRGLVSASPRGLAVRRYDRASGRKIHQEDFAQVFGWVPDRKYEARADAMLRVAAAILGEAGYDALLRRLVFAVAVGNHDAHLKNWSLVYADGRTPALSPMYDQVATVCWSSVERVLALPFGGTREPAQVDRALVRRVADRLGQDPGHSEEVAMTTLERVRRAWPGVWPLLPAGHPEEIRAHWNRVPLLRDSGPLP